MGCTQTVTKDDQRRREWQDKYKIACDAYSALETQMDERDKMYLGQDNIKPLVKYDEETNRATPHNRNLIAENIESMVDSSVPQPQVNAIVKDDEQLAANAEEMIRNELDRLPMERHNDLMERIVPLQGGGYWLVEWDNSIRTHDTIGDVVVTPLHPKEVVPQPGVYTGIEDMDHVFVRVPSTVEAVRAKYGVSVEQASEENPEVKGTTMAGDGNSQNTENDLLTIITAYYRNQNGGIGKFTWANDTTLEDLEDYQARRLRKCVNCGAVEPGPADETDEYGYTEPWEDRTGENAAKDAGLQMQAQAGDEGWNGILPNASQADFGDRTREKRKHVCPYCGGDKFAEAEEDYQDVYAPIQTENGTEIPGEVTQIDDTGTVYRKPTRIPFYKPNRYPIVLQRNVSVYGQLLGQSDADRIKDQQNTMNRMEKQVIDRLLEAGTLITLPDRPDIRVDPKNHKIVYIGNASDKNLIQQYDFSGNLQYEMAYMANVYEESRQILGITDSYQGRNDTTAQSGKAKQFAAQMSAGRLQSKKIMRQAAYADLFQLIFQFKLAYADEPRPIAYSDWKGNTEYGTFNRYDYLGVDDAGQWYWKDQFLFSVDPSETLANNRERLWEETTSFLQAGTYGDPAQLDTLILYWQRMDALHYPGANDVKQYLEQKLQEQQQAQAAMAAQQQAMLQAQAAQQPQQAQQAQQNPITADTAV